MSIGRVQLAILVGVTLSAWSCGGEFEEIEVDLGFRGKAKLNRFLAAERLLIEYGYDARSWPGVSDPPAVDEALVVPLRAVATTSAFTEQVIDWVHRGGHLLCFLEPYSREEMTLQRLEREASGDESMEKETIKSPVLDHFGVKVVARRDSLLTSRLRERDGTTTDFEVSFDSPHQFEVSRGYEAATDTVGAADATSFDVLSFAHRRGRVTFVASGDWFSNERIGTGKHASAFLTLIQLHPRTEGVWLVYDLHTTFLSKLFNEAWMFLLGLVVLVAFWVWSASGRVGPVRALDVTAQWRDFVDHIRASGRFLYHQGEAGRLIEAQRKHLIQIIRDRDPELREAHLDDVIRSLANRPGVDVDDAMRALTCAITKDPHLIFDVTRTLQQLEKHL